MKVGSTLLTVAVLLGSSCAVGQRSTEIATVATTVNADTGGPDVTIDVARQCVYTDPGRLPISVHRALSCPDGTFVSVRGIVTQSSAGSTLLCDAGPGAYCLRIEGGQAPNAFPLPGPTIGYSGTVAKGVLTVGGFPLLENTRSGLVADAASQSSFKATAFGVTFIFGS